MTFLELCTSLRREAGISGTGPTTTVDQSGEMLRVVEWVKTAYEDIQNLHANWDFLRVLDYQFNTTSSVSTYDPEPDHGEYKTDAFRCYLTDVGNAQDLGYVQWDEFRANFQRGTLSTQTGRPTVISVKTDKTIVLWPIPDAAYTITGEYFKTAQEFTEDASVPIIPTSFQKVILWKALMLYGAYNGANDAYSHGQNEYRKLMSKLERNQLPRVVLCGALA